MPASLRHHLRATAIIAAPIALAQLGQMAMALTDTVMLGMIDQDALAAGGLGASLFFITLIALQGVLSAVAVVAARAMGAGRPGEVAVAYSSGWVLTALLCVPAMLVLGEARALLLWLGEPALLATNVATYLGVLRWGMPGGLIGIGLMRALLPAIGREGLLLRVTPLAIIGNAVMNFWLIRGGLGVPALGLRGSAAATSCTLWGLAVMTLWLLHGRRDPAARVLAWVAPRWAMLRELLAIGLPVGAMVLVEASLFLAAALTAGRIGGVALPAHMVAISVASTSFMVPLAIAQAANVRVASAMGAGQPGEARRAGIAAILLAAGFMSAAAVVIRLVPGLIVAAFLHGGDPRTAPLAAALLGVVAVFQVADGVQTVAAGALRGLKDTAVPMLLAGIGYWGVGLTAGWWLAFRFDLGVVGLWWGLCAGLASVAVLLTLRFLRRSLRGVVGREESASFLKKRSKKLLIIGGDLDPGAEPKS